MWLVNRQIAGLRHRPTVHFVWPIHRFYSSCRMSPSRTSKNCFFICNY